MKRVPQNTAPQKAVVTPSKIPAWLNWKAILVAILATPFLFWMTAEYQLESQADDMVPNLRILYQQHQEKRVEMINSTFEIECSPTDLADKPESEKRKCGQEKNLQPVFEPTSPVEVSSYLGPYIDAVEGQGDIDRVAIVRAFMSHIFIGRWLGLRESGGSAPLAQAVNILTGTERPKEEDSFFEKAGYKWSQLVGARALNKVVTVKDDAYQTTIAQRGLYFDILFLGANPTGRPVIGGGAPYHYFSTPLKDLSPAQKAFIVGIIRAPMRYNPFTYVKEKNGKMKVVIQQDKNKLDNIITRVNQVIAQVNPVMKGQPGYPTQSFKNDKTDESRNAFLSVMKFKNGTVPSDTDKQGMIAHSNVLSIAETGEVKQDIPSTLDFKLQTLAQKAVNAIGPAAALLVADRATGRIVAVGQNSKSQLSLATIMLEPGSFAKVGEYSKVFEDKIAKPSDMVSDLTFNMGDPAPSWLLTGHNKGEVTIDNAFAVSDNAASARLLFMWMRGEYLEPHLSFDEQGKAISLSDQELISSYSNERGLALREWYRQLGFSVPSNDTTPVSPFAPSTILGTDVAKISLFNAVQLVTAIANRGKTVPLYILQNQTDRVEPVDIMSGYAADTMLLLMQGVVSNGTGRGLVSEKSPLAKYHPFIKTGSTKKQGVFTAGGTDHFVFAMWIGNTGYDEMDGTAAGLILPHLRKFLEQAYKTYPHLK